jgi:deazaflavin-dependent oxidoreductase (nitroreductase family)
MPLPQGLARFNRRATNRVTGLFAGRAPGFAILTHVGRRSGRSYRTPVNVFRDGNEYIIVLTYGAESDWVRNVLAAGTADLLTRGRHVRLTQPRIVVDSSMRWAPLPVRLLPRLAGVTEYMRLTPVAMPAARSRTDPSAEQERSLRA